MPDLFGSREIGQRLGRQRRAIAGTAAVRADRNLPAAMRATRQTR
jgi:hypothetical protein